MIHRSMKHLMFSMLVLGATLITVAPAHSQERQAKTSTGLSGTLRINWGSAFHWSTIPGTRVEELPSSERSDYDMFRYGGSYYAYDNDRWYMSARERGDFVAIDDQAVPSEFVGIPRDHWRNYPSRWADRGDNRGDYRGGDRGDNSGDYRDRMPMSMLVDVRYGARWYSVRGTHVQMIMGAQRPDYDLFRYGGTYYAFDNDRWYASRRSNGQFAYIDERLVPAEMSWVPRSAWQNYPSRWVDDRGRPRGDRGRRWRDSNRRY